MIDLQPFCADIPDPREYLYVPIRHGGHLYASNGHIAVRIPDDARPEATRSHIWPGSDAVCTQIDQWIAQAPQDPAGYQTPPDLPHHKASGYDHIEVVPISSVLAIQRSYWQLIRALPAVIIALPVAPVDLAGDIADWPAVVGHFRFRVSADDVFCTGHGIFACWYL